jgi:hypothetical protein
MSFFTLRRSQPPTERQQPLFAPPLEQRPLPVSAGAKQVVKIAVTLRMTAHSPRRAFRNFQPHLLPDISMKVHISLFKNLQFSALLFSLLRKP